MLPPKLCPQFVNFLHHGKWFFIYDYFGFGFTFDQQTKLRVSVSLHAAVVDVG
jgi:hypothetical protein